MDEDPNIIVNAVIDADAATIEALREPLLAMQAASRAENGCQDYTFSVELGDPEKVRITERWDNMDTLLAHFASSHMGSFRAAMAANPPRNLDAHFFEVNEIERPS